MGIGASISCPCMVLRGVVPGPRCRCSQLECAGHSWFLNTMVSGEREREWGTYRVGVVRVIAPFSPNMGYVRQGLQGGNESAPMMGAGEGIVGGWIVKREW